MGRQIGQFNLSVDNIEDAEMAEPLMAVFGTTLIIEAGYDIRAREYKYLALSPHFEEVEDGAEIPEYEPSVDGDGQVGWEKK
jgi:hypothetical protein